MAKESFLSERVSNDCAAIKFGGPRQQEAGVLRNDPRTMFRRVQATFVPAILIGVVCIFSAACASERANSDSVAAADAMPLAARIDRLDGEVGIDRQSDAQDATQNNSDTD